MCDVIMKKNTSDSTKLASHTVSSGSSIFIQYSSLWVFTLLVDKVVLWLTRRMLDVDGMCLVAQGRIGQELHY